MDQGIAHRRNFLSAKKNAGQRITIAFAGIADFRSFIGQEYLAGIMKACSDYDVNFINMGGAIKYSTFDDLDFIHHYTKNFKFMKQPLINGLVSWASTLCEYMEPESVTNLFTSLAPLPIVDIGYMDIPGVPSVRIDNTYSMSYLFKHLIKVHKYRKFAFVGSEISLPHQRRLTAYRAELAKYNIPELPNSVYMAKSMEPVDITYVIRKLVTSFKLHNHEGLDVIVTSSDIIAAELINEFDKLGIAVPKDVAITGFNNQYSGISAFTPITTINLEYFKRGYTAVELLIDKIIEPEKILESKFIKTSLVVRQSCGCFEQSILDAGKAIPIVKNLSEIISGSGKDLRNYLTYQIRNLLPQSTSSEQGDLIDSIFFDIYEQEKDSHLLKSFQRILQNADKRGKVSSTTYQQFITDLRALIIPLVKDDPEQILHMEAIFHQLRVFASVHLSYDTLSNQENAYTFSNLSKIAINFASATTEKQIYEVLRRQLGELEISGIILALSDTLTHDLMSASVKLILPEPQPFIQEKLPHKVYDPSCFPKMFLPQERRYSLMLETLYHDDLYFGYMLLEIGNQNISLYDTVRLLMSNALYTTYLKASKAKANSSLLNNDQIFKDFNLPDEDESVIKIQSGLTVRQIMNYLLEHLDEMTNLNKMADELLVSKSHLVRKTKEMTGFTVQELHEKLKIEQAKKLLSMGNAKLSEIASRLGFQNQNYFSSVFKKNTGFSPRKWAGNTKK